MAQVNPHASTDVTGLSANPTQPGLRRGVFWLVTVCLFLSVAVLLSLGTIPFYLLNPVLWLIVLPLWFVPIIISEIRASARRANPHRSGAYSFTVDMAKVIGIMFLIIVISLFSVTFFYALTTPSSRFPEAAKGSSNDTSGFPDEQPSQKMGRSGSDAKRVFD